MFCTNCGEKINDSARFCTSCGTPVGGKAAADEAANLSTDATVVGSASAFAKAQDTVQEIPVTTDDDQNTGDNPKRKRNIVIAIVAAVIVVVIIALIALFAFGGRDDSRTAVYYNSSEPMTVARSAVIIPTNSDGTPVSNYTVSITSAYDSAGNSMDVSGYQDIVVEGDDGFTVADIIGDDGEEGTYEMVVTDQNGIEQTLPPVEVDDSASSDTVYIEPDSQTISYSALFLDKINEIMDEHGGPEIISFAASETITYSYLIGLGYADLIDFGDGEQRLVVVYSDRDTMMSYSSDPSMSGLVNDYVLEIWEVSDEGDSLTLAWSGLSLLTNGGYPSLTILTNIETGNIGVNARNSSGDISSTQTIGLNDSGEIGTVETSLAETWQGEFFNFTEIIISNTVQTEDLAGYHSMDDTAETVLTLVSELEWLLGEDFSELSVIDDETVITEEGTIMTDELSATDSAYTNNTYTEPRRQHHGHCGFTQIAYGCNSYLGSESKQAW